MRYPPFNNTSPNSLFGQVDDVHNWMCSQFIVFLIGLEDSILVALIVAYRLFTIHMALASLLLPCSGDFVALPVSRRVAYMRP